MVVHYMVHSVLFPNSLMIYVSLSFLVLVSLFLFSVHLSLGII